MKKPENKIKISNFLIVVIAASFLMGCSVSSKRESENDWPTQVIDAHIHTSFGGQADKFSGVVRSKESLIAEMKANNVVGAVSLTHRYEDGYSDLKDLNVVHCAGVSEKPDIKKLEAGIKSGKFNCIKIYLGYVYQYAADKNYDPAYKLAEKYGVPVVLHTGDTLTADGLLKYSHPLGIDEVAVKYRKVNFVLAHLGNPWVQTAAEVAYKNPNVYVDVSALLIGKFSEIDPKDIEEYVVKPIRWAFGYMEDPSKMLYGSDWALVSMRDYIGAVKKAIPRENWNDVFYNNAQAVFKIKTLPEKVK